MRRFMAYGYRDLSDSDLNRILAFLSTPAGKRYVTAYNAAMAAGFIAMGRRTGEQLGESLREMAQAEPPPPPIASPLPALPSPAAPP
jgi:hypothetical protein